MFNRLRFLIPLLFGANILQAQDPVFSGSGIAPMVTNPAFAGTWASGRAQISSRLQWMKLPGNYQTYHASYDQYFRVGAIGASYTLDRKAGGLFTGQRAELYYAAPFGLFKKEARPRVVVQPGIGLAYATLKLDDSRLSFGDMMDPRRGLTYSSAEYFATPILHNFDLAAGMLVYSKRFVAGFSAFHLTRPNVSFYGTSRLDIRYVAHAAGIIGDLENDSSIRLVPSVTMHSQGSATNYMANLMASWTNFAVGIGYRSGDAILFSGAAGYRMFRLQYTYDLTISKLSGQTGGSHEFCLTYRFMDEKWKDRLNLRHMLL